MADNTIARAKSAGELTPFADANASLSGGNSTRPRDGTIERAVGAATVALNLDNVVDENKDTVCDQVLHDISGSGGKPTMIKNRIIRYDRENNFADYRRRVTWS
jgi:hypothetical protein